MKLTINEIAQMAHVAKSTVSKALNGQKGVSEENRSRILEIVRQVDFQPNASARALAQNKTDSIGLFLPHEAGYSLSGAYWASIITAVAEEVTRRGNTLTVISPEHEGVQQAETLRKILLRHSVDGLIIGAEQIKTQDIMNIMRKNMPFVFIGKNQQFDHYSVDVNNREGAYKVVQNLIARNYKNIGCIAGPQHYEYTTERITGCAEALTEAGLPPAPVLYTDYTREETIKNTEAFIEQNPQLDALFLAAGGEFVLNILEVLRYAGVDTRKFGIGVFDDSRIFDFLQWPIITARQPLREIGTTAACMLFSLINGTPPAEQTKCLSVDIILR